MSSLISRNNLILVGILLCVVLVSLQTLTTKPGLWVDEAKTILLARSYATHGTLDIETSPGEFSGVKPLLQSTGYPVTLPLGLVYRQLGELFALSRLYMLAWMCLAILGIYFIVSKISTPTLALFSTALIATFASFHDSGRTVVGEIPGFFFLITALYLHIHKKEYIFAGFFFSLALVTKPSVYLSILPALLILVLAYQPIWQDRLRTMWRLFIGSFVPVLLWIKFSIDHTSESGVLRQVVSFLGNPYGNSSQSNIIDNLLAIPHTSTIIYFGIFIILILLSYRRIQNLQVRQFIIFTLVYSAFAFIYYLRSPGWLRYLVVADMLILICLPVAMSYINLHWRLGLSVIIAFQIFHFFNLAQIQYSDAAESVADRVYSSYSCIPEGSCIPTIGLINAIEIAALLPNIRLDQVIEMDGIPRMGTNPLINPTLSAKLPKIVITAKDISRFGGEEVLARDYNLVETIKGYKYYEHK